MSPKSEIVPRFVMAGLETHILAVMGSEPRLHIVRLASGLALAASVTQPPLRAQDYSLTTQTLAVERPVKRLSYMG